MPDYYVNQVGYIWKATSAAELIDWLTSAAGDCAYFPSDDPGCRRTVEFREGDGALLLLGGDSDGGDGDDGGDGGGGDDSCDYPVAWAKAAVGIMAWAVRADLDAFGETVREVIAAAAAAAEDEDEGRGEGGSEQQQQQQQVGRLLRSVGVPEDAVRVLEARAKRLS